MSSSEECLKLMENLFNSADKALSHNLHDMREVFEETLKQRKSSIEDLKARLTKAESDNAAAKKRHLLASKKLNKVKNKIAAFKKKEEFEKLEELKTLTDASECTDQIQTLKSVLNTYKDVTGVRFNYKSPENTVSGFVGVKGECPEDSQLLPFSFDAYDPDVPNQIWEKVKKGSGCSVSEKMAE